MNRRAALFSIGMVLALAMLACSLTGAKNTPASGPNANAAPAEQDQPVVDQSGPAEAQNEPVSRGSGDFDLADPGAGLDGLSGYRQSLLLDFDGTLDGQAQQSQTRFTRVVAREPQTSLTWLGLDGQPEQFFGTLGALSYYQSAPDQPCSSAALAAGAGSEPAAALFELTSLPRVYGGVAAGDEDLNGMAAKHYTFDEQAIGYAGQAKASGEVWMAEPGGYVLRYSLRLEAPADLLGPGVAGVQTWTYELSDIDGAAATLPEGCQAQPSSSELPLPEGATVSLDLPGYLEYQVTASLEDSLAFYQQQAESLGWGAEAPVQFEQVSRLALRATDGSLVQLSFRAEGDRLTVTVQTVAPAAPASE